MREYVISISFAVILCAAADMLVPSKKYRGIIKIVCGMFVISSIVSPIGEILKFDFTSFNSDIFLNDDSRFYDIVNKSRENYTQYLAENSQDILISEVGSDISNLAGEAVRVQLNEDVLILYGVDVSKRDEISAYVKRNYGLNTSYMD